MKVLSGHLKEELYEYPQESDNVRPLKLWRESLMAENQVAYMSDKLGIHRMVNPDPHRLAVSLHCKVEQSLCFGNATSFVNNQYTPRQRLSSLVATFSTDKATARPFRLAVFIRNTAGRSQSLETAIRHATVMPMHDLFYACAS